MTFIYPFLFFLLYGVDAQLSSELLTDEFDAPPLPELPLDQIQLPEGFEIKLFATVDNARSITVSPSGIVYAGNRNGDKVYAMVDEDGDYVADKQYVIDSGLNIPNGVAFRDGDLYVAEVNRILKYSAIESSLENPPSPEVIYDEFPTEKHHGWKNIAFGPDGKLYVPVGAPCNICVPEKDVFASITRLNPDGTGFEIFASGVRNSVGLTWHPETNVMWFTDNGRDMLGDDSPSCELNRAHEKGMHFGYPYCHAGSIKDPEFGLDSNCDEYTPPADLLGPHVAPLGLKFYAGNQFPDSYKNNLFIAEHGSWNRAAKIGYRIVTVKVADGVASSNEVFASGWLNEEEQKAWGRPVDVVILSDGSMLISDDYAGVIYRISYKG